jgi:hypothetical protein
MAKSRKRGEYWSARWIYADGTDGEQGGFLTEDDADIYAAEQKLAERKKRKYGFLSTLMRSTQRPST